MRTALFTTLLIFATVVQTVDGLGDTVAAPEAQGPFRVSAIRITGNRHLSTRSLMEQMAVKKQPWYRFWATPPRLDNAAVADDANRILRHYRSRGFYHAQVTPRIDAAPGPPPRRARVTYVVTEGTPVMVRTITFDVHGDSATFSRQQLLDAVHVRTDTRFEEKAYRRAKQSLERYFGARGYPMAEVTGKVRIHPNADKAEIHFTVTPGPRCLFGETQPEDADATVRKEILQRARQWEEGTLYDVRKVEQTQRNLYNLDVFKAAVIRPGAPDPITGRVPMTVAVKPKKRQRIKGGLGYGDEDGIRARLGWTYRNLGRRAGRLTVEARRSDLIRQASASYEQPYFLDAKTAFQMEAGFLAETLDAYDSRRFLGMARVTRRLKENWALHLEYRLEQSDLADLMLADQMEQRAFLQDNSFRISAGFLEISWDTTNSEPNPRKGWRFDGSVETATSLMGSEIAYVKPSMELARYQPLPFDTILAGRFRIQALQEMEDTGHIPIFKRLFLGGAHTVRGYAFQKLGPRDAGGTPQGGRSAALGNLELRRHIAGKVSGVLFFDVGTVERAAFHWTPDSLRYTAGAGIRFDTPIGPLRLDAGYKLNPQNVPAPLAAGDPEKESRWRLHFNIGHAF